MEGLWQRAAERMRDHLGPASYETWIGPLNFVGVEGNTATIEAPNKFFRDWVNDRYIELLKTTLSAERGGSVNVALTFDSHKIPPRERQIPMPEETAVTNGNGHEPTKSERRPQLN